MVKTGQAVTRLFTTTNPATGAAANSAATPVGTLYVNGIANAATVTVTNITTGVYKAAVTMPTLAAGDSVDLRIACTVNSVAGEGVIWNDNADTVYASEVPAGVWSATTRSITNLPTAGEAATYLGEFVTNGSMFAAGVFTDAGGSPVDPTGMTSQYRRPDGVWGTIGTPSQLNGQVGLYGITHSTTAMNGVHLVSITGTVGGVTKRLLFSGTVVAAPSAAPSAASVATAVWGDATRSLTATERVNIATTVWSRLTSSLITADSIGKRIVDFIGSLIYTAPPTDYAKPGDAMDLVTNAVNSDSVQTGAIFENALTAAAYDHIADSVNMREYNGATDTPTSLANLAYSAVSNSHDAEVAADAAKASADSAVALLGTPVTTIYDAIAALVTNVAAGIPTYETMSGVFVVAGTNRTGSVLDTTSHDGVYLEYAENSVTGLNVEFEVASSSIDSVPLLLEWSGRYNANNAAHLVNVVPWNYMTGAWETDTKHIATMLGRTSDFEYSLPLNNDHHDENTGAMKLRFKHNTATYNTSHYLALDSLRISKVATTNAMAQQVAAILSLTQDVDNEVDGLVTAVAALPVPLDALQTTAAVEAANIGVDLTATNQAIADVQEDVTNTKLELDLVWADTAALMNLGPQLAGATDGKIDAVKAVVDDILVDTGTELPATIEDNATKWLFVPPVP